MEQEKITIVDYGMGNLGSIVNMLKKIGRRSEVSADPSVVRASDRLILPGVGAFSEGMKKLEDAGLRPALNYAVLERQVPVLGICLGMHLLARASEEGEGEGLSWIAARSVRFRDLKDSAGRKLKIPHMGWSEISPESSGRLFRDRLEDERYYFVHSYHVVVDDSSNIAATADYGQPFVAAVEQDNIFGVQFHPEKSHKFGMRLLSKFAGIQP